MIAALYVADPGVYMGLPGVDPWPEARDARKYAGPWPVVAHPPCARWGRYWSGGPSGGRRFKKGDDDGCFAAAVDAVRRWGGVIEHPEASHAWPAFGINKPPKSGGWVPAGIGVPGLTCCVEQGHYGHRARKATWLYLVGINAPPQLTWGRSGATLRLDDGFHSTEERRKATRRGATERMTHREILATPLPFRDLLISMAEALEQ